MAGRSALLIAVPEHILDPEHLSLPVTRNDVAALQGVLEKCHYSVQTCGVGDPHETSRGFINNAMRQACLRAPKDGVLLIYFSGHGLHYSGKDLVVPSDAGIEDPTDFSESLVDTDITKYADNSPAKTILFFIDACREGLEWNQKAVFQLRGWGTSKRSHAEDRRFVRIFSCTPGEVSRYVTGEDGYSLFGRALTNVFSPDYPAETIGDVLRAAQEELDRLAREANKPRQKIPSGDIGGWDEEFLGRRISDVRPGEGATRRTDVRWHEAATECQLWRQDSVVGLADSPVLTALQQSTTALIRVTEEQWDRAEAALPGDQWRDRSYPLRVLESIELLVGASPDLKLSASETAVAIAAPFVREGVYACGIEAMSEAAPLDLNDETVLRRTRLGRRLVETHQSYPRLIRSAQAGPKQPAHDAIACWLLHRCLMRDPALWQPEPDGSITSKLWEALESADRRAAQHGLTRDRLIELARCLSADGTRIQRRDRPSALQIRLLFESDGVKTEVREQVVAYLLCVASWMALDVRIMPDLLADHVGLSDGIQPQVLVDTLARGHWRAVGGGRSLELTCPHPAIDVAIRATIARAQDVVDEMMRNAAENDSSLAVLRTLPRHLGADYVKPERIGGVAAYQRPHLTFQLAHDEIRELLMAEQLYDKPELAIRELYQNALDACRYRAARLEYLERTGEVEAARPWSGQIEFKQGKDSQGRAYIECRDNGIGMGHRELADSFSKAGKRFADLPEFIEERSNWLNCRPPIHIYPNSRFGIGVFSYFMLADALEIETCRLDLKGRPGSRLLVTVPGSGSVFRVRDIGRGKEAGTRVRLYLRNTESVQKVSCVKTLRSLLWLAEFPTTASHGWRRVRWEAGKLRHPQRRRAQYAHKEGTPIWWTTESGTFLADGITVECEHSSTLLAAGMIVNFAGEFKPPLTIDRRKIRAWDEERVLAWAVDSLPSLRSWPENSMFWLWHLARRAPRFAERLEDLFRGATETLTVAGRVNGLRFSIPTGYVYGHGDVVTLLFERPEIAFDYDYDFAHTSETIDPAALGVPTVQVNVVGFDPFDAILLRWIATAWATRSGPLALTRPPLPRRVGQYEFASEPEDVRRVEFAATQRHLLQRLKPWAKLGLRLPPELAQFISLVEQERHHVFRFVPASRAAWLRLYILSVSRVRNFARGITAHPVEAAITTMAVIVFILLIALAVIGIAAGWRYVTH
jgi:hypothetical protein